VNQTGAIPEGRTDVAQGTIKQYDDATGTGTVVTDDRVEVVIDPKSIGDQHIRMLRIGQRVRFETAEDDGATVARALHIVTFGDR
jgi:cold shock CspA family protein